METNKTEFSKPMAGKPEVKPEVKPEMKSESKPEAKPDVRPDPKADVKSETTTQNKMGAQSSGETSGQPNAKPRAETTNIRALKPESGSERSESRHQANDNRQVAPQNGQSVDGDWIGKIGGHATELDQTLQGFVKERPLLAVAIAVGIGFAGSFLLSKLTSSRSTEMVSEDNLNRKVS